MTVERKKWGWPPELKSKVPKNRLARGSQEEGVCCCDQINSWPRSLRNITLQDYQLFCFAKSGS